MNPTTNERTTTMNATYELNVYPAGFEGLTPLYDLNVWAEINGENGTIEQAQVTGLDGVDEWLIANGYRRVTGYLRGYGNGHTAELRIRHEQDRAELRKRYEQGR